MLDMYYAFTVALAEVCVQCTMWLFYNNNNNSNHVRHLHFILVLSRTYCGIHVLITRCVR